MFTFLVVLIKSSALCQALHILHPTNNKQGIQTESTSIREAQGTRTWTKRCNPENLKMAIQSTFFKTLDPCKRHPSTMVANNHQKY